MNMKNKMILALVGLAISSPVFAMGDDDPIVTKVMIDQLETRITNGDDPTVLEAKAWTGTDLNKIVVKVDAEQVKNNLEELELQALYSRAIDPYWDFQVGVRQDQKPKPVRNWLALGFEGLAPYFFDVDSMLFIGESNRVALRLKAEYEAMITQKWVLSPEMEINLYSKDDAETGAGSGLANTRVGLRLRYEIRREFAPYIGVTWNRLYGNTANFAKNAGSSVESSQIVAGIRAWF